MKQYHFFDKIQGVGTLITNSIGLGSTLILPLLFIKYKSALFIYVYLSASLLLTLPITIAELILGRHTKKSIAYIFAKNSKTAAIKWSSVFYALAFIPIVILHTILGGYFLLYCVLSICRITIVIAPATLWGNIANSAFAMFLTPLAMVAIAMATIQYRTARNAVLFYLFMIPFGALFITSTALPSFTKALKSIFLNLQPLSHDELQKAFMLAIFSSATGIGKFVMEGNALRSQNDIPLMGLLTTLSTMVISIMAVVMFTTFAMHTHALGFNIHSLFLEILQAYQTTAISYPITVLMFTALFLGSINSLTSSLETVTKNVIDITKLPPKRALSYVAITAILMALFVRAIIDLNMVAAVTIYCLKAILPLALTVTALFSGWHKYAILTKGFQTNSSCSKWLDIWLFLIQFIIPISAIFIWIL